MPTPNCQSQPSKETILKKAEILAGFRLEAIFNLFFPKISTAGFACLCLDFDALVSIYGEIS